MDIVNLRVFDGTSAGITIPKDHLRLEGMVGDDEVVEQPQLVIEHVEPGTWKLTRVSEYEQFERSRDDTSGQRAEGQSRSGLAVRQND